MIRGCTVSPAILFRKPRASGDDPKIAALNFIVSA